MPHICASTSPPTSSVEVVVVHPAQSQRILNSSCAKNLCSLLLLLLAFDVLGLGHFWNSSHQDLARGLTKIILDILHFDSHCGK